MPWSLLIGKDWYNMLGHHFKKGLACTTSLSLGWKPHTNEITGSNINISSWYYRFIGNLLELNVNTLEKISLWVLIMQYNRILLKLKSLKPIEKISYQSLILVN